MRRISRVQKYIWFAWFACIVVSAWSLFAAFDRPLGAAPDRRALQVALAMLNSLVPILFVIPATLIITRQPRHTIGWMFLIPSLAAVLSDAATRYLGAFQASPPPATLPILLLAWFTSVSWLASIFPLLIFPLLFPTGRLPSPRWRWVIYLAAGMCLFFMAFSISMRTIQVEFVPWVLANPIGFLDVSAFETIMPLWSGLMLVLLAASLGSLVGRYRRAGAVEREQIKWLLYACSIFAFSMILGVIANTPQQPASQFLADVSDLLFTLAVISIPAAIAIAILRYHLFDIDVIIRLTLVYAIVTGLLGLVFTGGIILLQGLFLALTGQASDLAVVVTTLTIAALFNPLRLRIQALIDRRFYRQKYNAEQALAQFAAAARDGSDLDLLTTMLEEVVRVNLQPTQAKLFLKGAGEDRQARPGASAPAQN